MSSGRLPTIPQPSERWNELHAAWLVRNDARKTQARAARDAARDWKYEQRDRSEASKQRRAARELLTRFRQKRLLHLTSAELDKLFHASHRFTGRKTDSHEALDGLWEALLDESLPLSWACGNFIKEDPATGQSNTGSRHEPCTIVQSPG